MRNLILILSVSLIFGLVACGKSTKKKVAENEMKSKSDVRMTILDQYKECVTKANGDPARIEACDSYLDAAKKIE